MPSRPKPFAFIILDGWGYREEKTNNAIAAANKPNWDSLCKNYTHTLISGSGRCVGLPSGQMGNSEVGHLNMGAGRIIKQDLALIDDEIVSGVFFKNETIIKQIHHAIKTNQSIHVMGLLSPGGVHSHENHIFALIELASKLGVKKLYIHAFLDGRDTPPKSAEASITALLKHCAEWNCGQIVTLIGRFFAMDRDKRWERVQKAYELMVLGVADFQASDALIGLQLAYQRGETDEFVQATAIHSLDQQPITIQEGDTVFFMNFRADRARELTHAFLDENFNGFPRTKKPSVHLIGLTEYDATFAIPLIYPPKNLSGMLGQHLSDMGLKQLRMAETEKYAHVTFFFNGGIEKAAVNEDRILIPSPQVATYDLKPEMSALEVTEELIKQIHSQKYDVIICNFANPDMVGHTGNFPATVKAIETIDQCLGKVIAALKAVGGEALITADHGNAEIMFDPVTNQPHTAHTTELVPLLYVGRKASIVKTNGILADIAPTMLTLLDLPIPNEMEGQAIFKLDEV